MSAQYPFYILIRMSKRSLFGLKVLFPKFFFRWDWGFNPVNWATDYNLPELEDEFYCYDDYDENDFWDDSYYGADYDDYGDSDDYDKEELETDSLENLAATQGKDIALEMCQYIDLKSGYRAIASKYFLIADIDCGNSIDEPLAILQLFLVDNPGIYRVYKTLNGMRYIQTDVMYQGVNRSAVATLEALGSDPKYIDFCKADGLFKARVTPKRTAIGMQSYLEAIKKDEPTAMKVCDLIGIFSSNSDFPLMPDYIASFVHEHDYLCRIEQSLPLG